MPEERVAGAAYLYGPSIFHPGFVRVGQGLLDDVFLTPALEVAALVAEGLQAHPGAGAEGGLVHGQLVGVGEGGAVRVFEADVLVQPGLAHAAQQAPDHLRQLQFPPQHLAHRALELQAAPDIGAHGVVALFFVDRLSARIAVEAVVEGRLVDGRKGADVGLILGTAQAPHGEGHHEWEGEQSKPSHTRQLPTSRRNAYHYSYNAGARPRPSWASPAITASAPACWRTPP
ncbi:hypothetical protein [Archangium sp.]|uniref:hypothetical protein n=1 Tax=Archangium sp. TaxID=1872627 RepID=UPI002D6025A5|nr:hypothetical protein [Archangium sp.]HYO53572.1 hypothetical protein [Archangium sp.]